MERKKKGSDCFVEDILIMPGSSFRPLAGDSRRVSMEYTELGNPSECFSLGKGRALTTRVG